MSKRLATLQERAMKSTMLRVIAAWTLLAGGLVHAAPPDLSALVPLNSPGEQKYQGFVGGLYPDGRNEPTGPIAEALARVSMEIRPLDANGKPSESGKIVVAGVGASVCRQIFAELEKLAPETSGVSPAVVFVNCALGGQDVNKIADPAGRYWTQSEATLKARGLTPAQVQVVWYQSDDLRDSRDDFPGRPERLKESLVTQMQLIRQHFPNARICYHSARHTTAYLPEGKEASKHAEPRPYHVGWAVKWLLEEQQRGRGELKFEGPAAAAPLVAWSPYFWTAGEQVRHDGYRWARDDVVQDGVHLSPSAQTRVAKELLAFFAKDAYARMWFGAGDATRAASVSTPNASAATAPSVARGKEAGANEAVWIVNGANKLPKLKRLVGDNDFVRVVIRDLDGKVVAEIEDILNRRTDLNQVAGAGQYRLQFFDRGGRPIELTQQVGEILRLK